MANTFNSLIVHTLTGTTGITSYTEDRIYYKYLPSDFENSNVSLLYNTGISNINNTFSSSDITRDYNLNILIAYKQSTLLWEVAEEVITAIQGLDYNYSSVIYVDYLGDDLLYNPDGEYYSLTLTFNVEFESGSNNIEYLKPLAQYTEAELISGLSQDYINTLSLPATWTNSNSSITTEIQAGEEYIAPDVNHIDSDGSTVTLPSGVAFTATPQYSDEAINALQRFELYGDTTLSFIQKTALTDLIDNLVNAGQFEHFTEIYLRAGLGSAANSLIGLKEFTSTNYGATWTNTGGFMGDGVLTYVDTNINLVDKGITNFIIGAKIGTINSLAFSELLGAYDGNRLDIYNNSTSLTVRSFAGSVIQINYSGQFEEGKYYSVGKTPQHRIYENDVIKTTGISDLLALPNLTIHELGTNGLNVKFDGSIQLSYYANSQIDLSIVQPIFDQFLTTVGVI